MKLMIILGVLLMAAVVDAFIGSISVRIDKRRNAEMTEDAMKEEGIRDVDLTPQQKEEVKHDLVKKIKEDVEEERLKFGV